MAVAARRCNGGGDLGAVGGRCEVVARAGSERLAGAGDEHWVPSKHC